MALTLRSNQSPHIC